MARDSSPESIPLAQTDFTGGEISPQMYDQPTWPKYAAALRTCSDWLPIPEGALVKRPGTVYVNQIRDMSKQSRLIPFIFSDGQTFVLEFGALYIRFYTLGKFVGTGFFPNNGTPWELPSQYTQVMLPYIKYSQVGNTITLCYGGQVGGSVAPQDLTKTSGAPGPWTLSPTPTAPPAGIFIPALSAQLPVWDNLTNFIIGQRVVTGSFVTGITGTWIAINASGPANSVGAHDPGIPAIAADGVHTVSSVSPLFWAADVDPAHPAATWQLVLTAVIQDAFGVTFESLPSAPKTLIGPLSTDRQQPISGFAPTIPAGYTVLYYKYYRGTNGVFGLISQLTPAQVIGGTYFDNGGTPDYTQQPPQGTDPFLINGADSYPSVVGYIDQRRAFADALPVPNLIQTSATGNLYRFDKPIPGQDSDSTSIVLASEVLEQIRSFLSLKCNLVFTGQGEWVFPDQVYTRSSGGPRKLSSWGSSWLNPIKLGNGAIYNTAKSNQVRDFFPLYGLYTSIWDGDDLTAVARHFFEHHTLVDWAFQSVPYPVIWMVRDDGVLLTLTYERTTKVKPLPTAAWAQHHIGGSGAVESICVVPEPPEDAVYVIVNRTVNGGTVRYIERMASPIPATSQYVTPGSVDQRYVNYLDSSVLFDGHQSGFANLLTLDSTGAPGNTSPGTYVALAQVTLAVAINAFAATDVDASAVIFDPENATGLGPLQVNITGFTDARHVTGELQNNLTQAQINAWAVGASGGITAWGLAKSVYALPSLAGIAIDSGDASGSRGLAVLGDGAQIDPASYTFVAGVVTLQSPSLVTIIGLSYNSDVELLDAYHPSAEIRNKYKKVNRVGFEVANARSLWVGEDFNEGSLREWNQRDVADSYNVMGLSTGYFSEFIEGDWNTGGRAVLRHFDPLPCIVTSVLRELALGGD